MVSKVFGFFVKCCIINLRVTSSVGRASPLHGGGHGFESHVTHFLKDCKARDSSDNNA